MKKEDIFVIISVAAAFVLLVVGIYIGEAQAAELERINRVEKALERAAEQTGYESLGVIDAYAVSQRNGMIYDGPAIRAELFNRIGLEAPDNSWAFTFGEFDGMMLIKLVVYKGPMKEPVWEQEVEKVYLYGVL